MTSEQRSTWRKTRRTLLYDPAVSPLAKLIWDLIEDQADFETGIGTMTKPQIVKATAFSERHVQRAIAELHPLYLTVKGTQRKPEFWFPWSAESDTRAERVGHLCPTREPLSITLPVLSPKSVANSETPASPSWIAAQLQSYPYGPGKPADSRIALKCHAAAAGASELALAAAFEDMRRRRYRVKSYGFFETLFRCRFSLAPLPVPRPAQRETEVREPARLPEEFRTAVSELARLKKMR